MKYLHMVCGIIVLLFAGCSSIVITTPTKRQPYSSNQVISNYSKNRKYIAPIFTTFLAPSLEKARLPGYLEADKRGIPREDVEFINETYQITRTVPESLWIMWITYYLLNFGSAEYSGIAINKKEPFKPDPSEIIETELATSETPLPKNAGDAVQVWDSNLIRVNQEYSQSIGLFIHYKNQTGRKVIGILIHVVIYNAFGKEVLSQTYEDETVLQPNERLKNSTYYKFEDNEFINDEPYDRMWKMADSGTAKIKTKILKVIFEDGTVLTTK